MFEQREITGRDAAELYRLQRAIAFTRDRATRLSHELEAMKLLVMATCGVTSADDVEFVIGPAEVLITYQTS